MKNQLCGKGFLIALLTLSYHTALGANRDSCHVKTISAASDDFVCSTSLFLLCVFTWIIMSYVLLSVKLQQHAERHWSSLKRLLVVSVSVFGKLFHTALNNSNITKENSKTSSLLSHRVVPGSPVDVQGWKANMKLNSILRRGEKACSWLLSRSMMAYYKTRIVLVKSHLISCG